MPILLQKSFWGDERNFLEPRMRFTSGDVREPYRFIQNRPGISVLALKSNTAGEKRKDQLSRDFPGRSIFDFCNNIRAKRTFGVSPTSAKCQQRGSRKAHSITLQRFRRTDPSQGHTRPGTQGFETCRNWVDHRSW